MSLKVDELLREVRGWERENAEDRSLTEVIGLITTLDKDEVEALVSVFLQGAGLSPLDVKEMAAHVEGIVRGIVVGHVVGLLLHSDRPDVPESDEVQREQHDRYLDSIAPDQEDRRGA